MLPPRLSFALLCLVICAIQPPASGQGNGRTGWVMRFSRQSVVNAFSRLPALLAPTSKTESENVEDDLEKIIQKTVKQSLKDFKSQSSSSDRVSTVNSVTAQIEPITAALTKGLKLELAAEFKNLKVLTKSTVVFMEKHFVWVDQRPRFIRNGDIANVPDNAVVLLDKNKDGLSDEVFFDALTELEDEDPDTQSEEDPNMQSEEDPDMQSEEDPNMQSEEEPNTDSRRRRSGFFSRLRGQTQNPSSRPFSFFSKRRGQTENTPSEETDSSSRRFNFFGRRRKTENTPSEETKSSSRRFSLFGKRRGQTENTPSEETNSRSKGLSWFRNKARKWPAQVQIFVNGLTDKVMQNVKRIISKSKLALQKISDIVEQTINRYIPKNSQTQADEAEAEPQSRRSRFFSAMRPNRKKTSSPTLDRSSPTAIASIIEFYRRYAKFLAQKLKDRLQERFTKLENSIKTRFESKIPNFLKSILKPKP